jgi:hypothetical protein
MFLQSSKKLRLVLSFFLISFAVLVSYNHEFWRDEGHIVNMAITLNIKELLIEGRIEGFFPIHQILLKFIYYLSNSKEFSLKVLPIFFYILTNIVLFRYYEINNYIFLLFLLSYPIFFEYSVYTKHYGFLIPSIIYLILEKEKKIETLIFNLIFLCSNGIFGIIISFTYCTANLNFFLNLFKKKTLLFLTLILFCIFFSWFLLPTQERSWNPLHFPDLKFIFTIVSKLLLSLFYIPAIFLTDLNIIGYIFFAFLTILAIIFIILILLNILQEKNELKNLFFYLLTNILFLIFFLITTHHTWRHYYFFSVFSFLFAINLTSLKSEHSNIISQKTKLPNYFLKRLLIFFLIISCVGNFLISTGDIKYNFSNSKNLSTYLKLKKIDCNKVLSYPGYSASSWTVYFNEECKTFFLENNKIGSFYSLKSVVSLLYQPDPYFLYFKDLIISTDKNYLVILCKKNCSEEREDLLTTFKINKIDINIFNEPFLNSKIQEKFILAKIH